MNLEILDCTLRDGGYTNNWQFNQEFIISTINSLINSQVKNIECGYLTDIVEITNSNSQGTKLNFIDNFNTLLSNIDKKDSIFYIMIDFNTFDISNLTSKNNSLIDGIRLAFHKKDLKSISQYAKMIKSKGYKLFIQPMAIHLYSDSEINDLILLSEDIKPDSLYIVDSFGVLDYFDLKEYFLKLNSSLDKSISIGLHLHNNIDTAFSNSINILKEYKNFERNIIIDSSISGIGRGAGNIKTEFLLLYLNKKFNLYKPEYILSLIDSNDFFNNDIIKKDIAYFISGINKIHPSKILKNIDNNSLESIYLTE